jgi:hypothetical protein
MRNGRKIFRIICWGKVSAASAYTYSGMVRGALNQAVKENIIITSPARNIKRIKAAESKCVWLNSEELERPAAAPLNSVDGEEIRRVFLFGVSPG